MFGIQHHPTPEVIIKKMLEPYIKVKPRVFKDEIYETFKLDKYSILEPSAGSGNIVKYINKNYSDSDVFALEIDNSLQILLRELKCKILGSDFLDFDNRLKLNFDLIIMNPPFKDGAKHLLHAWKILDEGDIVCLLNAETIENPYSEDRQLLAKIIEDNGNYEILGSVFEDSENETNVNVVMVRLHKKAEEKLFDFKFDTNHKIADIDLSGEDFKTAIATKDIVGNMMLRYDMSLKAYVEVVKSFQYLMFCTQGLTPRHGFDWSVNYGSKPEEGYQKFAHTINSGMWAIACSELGIENLMTDKVRKDFERFKAEQGYLEFNKKNVADLITMLFENQNLILERAITDVFDMFTSYHKENRLHVEGWKTNDKWKVNKKVILPRWLQYGEYCSKHHLDNYGDRLKINYSYQSEYSDIDKVMCFISGRKMEHINTLYVCLQHLLDKIGFIKTGDKFESTGVSTFFNFKFFKKGTLHIEFRDEKLWQEFNMRACKAKNWLPPAEEDAWKKSKQQKQEDMVKPTHQESKYSPSSQQLLLL